MAFLLGLTGNIACGKSTVGRLLSGRYGAEYLDTDRLVHEQYAAGGEATRAIAERFGRDLLRADGTIDRRRLGEIVMRDAGARRDLEAILHPPVRRAVERRATETSAPVLVVDAILLIEAGLAARCDAVWVVVCDRAEQLRRLQATRGFTPEEAALRVDAQASQEEKVKHATAVIENRGSLADLERQVEAAWRRTVAPRLEEAASR